MKKIFVAILLVANFAGAEESQTQKPPAQDNSKKMTTKDAKKSCKDEGKKGADLIQCMKEKKEEK